MNLFLFFGEQAHQDYTPSELLRMGKDNMARVLCAYETNLLGSAAEKLAQRGGYASFFFLSAQDDQHDPQK